MTKLSEFEQLLIRSQNELGTSVLLILLWIAASDGAIHPSEIKSLSEVSEETKHGHDIRPLIVLAKNRNHEAIQLACEILQNHFHGEKANLFLSLAIGMAIADGYLLATENHILRFLADLLGVNRKALNGLFISITGKEMPEPSDPSKATYWQAKEKARQRRNTNSSSQSSQTSGHPPSRDSKTVGAYATLGLEFGASKEEIKIAYRRLAQVHHPDRFSSLGGESVSAATKTFQRIKIAYDHLVKHA